MGVLSSLPPVSTEHLLKAAGLLQDLANLPVIPQLLHPKFFASCNHFGHFQGASLMPIVGFLQ